MRLNNLGYVRFHIVFKLREAIDEKIWLKVDEEIEQIVVDVIDEPVAVRIWDETFPLIRGTANSAQ